MADVYAFKGSILEDGSFYRITLDDAARTVGQLTEVSPLEATPALVEDWRAGRIMKLGEVEAGAKAGSELISDAEFAYYVLVPAFNLAYEQGTSYADSLARVRAALGDSPEIITLFASHYDERMAGEIWGVKFADATDHQAGPELPVPAPANVVVGDRQTQGLGTVPNATGQVSGSGSGGQGGTGGQGQGTGGGTGSGSGRGEGAAEQNPRTGGDPVILFSGQLLMEATDLEVPGRGLHFRLNRTYLHRTGYRGPLGYGWDHSWNLWLREVQETEPGGRVVNAVYRSTGRVRADRFVHADDVGDMDNPPGGLDGVADASFEAPPGTFDTLVKAGGAYRCTLASGVVVEYRSDTLQAERIVDLNGNEVRLRYDVENRLVEVEDPVGKRFGFANDDLGRLVAVEDRAGNRRVVYGYDDAGDLVSVDIVGAGGEVLETDYAYTSPDEPAELQHNLMSVQNQSGALALQVEYGTDAADGAWNRVVRQLSEDGEWSYAYEMVVDTTAAQVDADADPVNVPYVCAHVTGPRGHVSEQWFNDQGNVVYASEPFYGGVPDARVEWRYRYNVEGLLTAEQRPDGGWTVHSYGREAYADAGNDPDAAPPADRRRFGERRRTVVGPAPGSGEQRTIVTEFDYTDWLRVSAQRGPFWGDDTGAPLAAGAEPEVTFAHDAAFNLVEIVYPDTQAPDGTVRQGPRHRFVYDANGELIEASAAGAVTRYEKFADEARSGFTEAVLRDPGGADMRVEYDVDEVGRVASVTAPRDAREEFAYDGLGRLAERVVVDPSGREGRERLTYDTTGRLVEWRATDEAPAWADPPPERVNRWRYDAFGRVLADIEGPDPDPRETRHVYGPDGQLERSRDPAGLVVELRRERTGRVIEAITARGQPEETTRRFRWRSDGQLEAIVDQAARAITFLYDAFGRRVGQLDRDGIETRRELDASGQPLRELVTVPVANGPDERWSETEWVHDPLGRVTRMTRHLFDPPSNATSALLEWTFDLDDAGRPVSVTDPTGAAQTTTYDALGRPLTATDADGTETTWTWDEVQGAVAIVTTGTATAPGGAQTKLAESAAIRLDPWARPVEWRDGAGNRSRFAYDTAGRLIRETDPAGTTTTHTYDPFGELAAIEVAGGTITARTTFERDRRGEPVRTRFPGGRIYEVTRDLVGRPLTVNTAAAPTKLVWDEAGHLAATIEPDGIRTDYDYSPEGRLLRSSCDRSALAAGPGGYQPAASGNVAYIWTPAGMLARVDDGTTRVDASFDSLGRLTRDATTGPHGTWAFRARYDDAGRPTELIHPDGRRVGWAWSAAGRCMGAQLLDQGASGLGGAGAPRDLLTVERAGDRAIELSAGGATVSVGYDPAGRAAEARWTDQGGADLRIERRLYGAAGECRVEAIDTRTALIDHDPLTRLIRYREHTVAPPLDIASVLGHDAAGLPVADQGDCDALPPAGLPAATRDVAWELDEDGNRRRVTESGTATPYTLGSGGRVSAVGAAGCTYDAAGRLISIGGRDYAYDDRGRLVSVDAGGGSQVSLDWDPLGRLLAVDDGQSVTVRRHFGPLLGETATGGNATAQFTWAAGRLWNVASSGTEATVVSDLAGNVVGGIDGAGNLLASPALDPFGVPAGALGTVNAGYRSMPGVAGLWLFPSRAYDPGTGRFLQPDPAGLDGDVHPYLFARHSPLRFDDPWGLASGDIDWGIVARNAAPPLALGLAGAVAIGFAVAAGIVSAPFVLIAGGILLAGAALLAYLNRANEALDAGLTDYQGRAALAAAGDIVGVTNIYEGWKGESAISDLALTGTQRSERLGQGFGTLGATLAGGRAFKLGAAGGKSFAAAHPLAAYRASIAYTKPWNPRIGAVKKTPLAPPDPATEQSFANLLTPDSAPPPKLRSAAAAADAAVESGLVSADRLGMQRHNRAGVVRTILGMAGDLWESAHVVPQAVGKLIPNYSPGKALTTLLPVGTHKAFDKAWVPIWNARIAAGTKITAGEVNALVGAAIDQIPASMLSPAAKGTLRWRLFAELFGELKLTPDTVIVPGK